MSLTDRIRELIFPGMVVAVVGILWMVAQAQATIAQADRGYFPAILPPVDYSQVSDPSDRDSSRPSDAPAVIPPAFSQTR